MANTTLTITVPEAQATRVINALCTEAHLEATGANAKAVIIALVKARVEAYERQTATVESVDLT